MKRNEEVARIDSCLNKAHDDEPIFVLRANDELAPAIVGTWAADYEVSKRRAQGGQLTEKQNTKVDEAWKLAEEMRAWRLVRETK